MIKELVSNRKDAYKEEKADNDNNSKSRILSAGGSKLTCISGRCTIASLSPSRVPFTDVAFFYDERISVSESRVPSSYTYHQALP